jgi:hypothetical protein
MGITAHIRGQLTAASYRHFGKIPSASIRERLEEQGFAFHSTSTEHLQIKHPEGGALHPAYGNPSSGYDPAYGETITADRDLYQQRWDDFTKACIAAFDPA